MKKTPVVRTPSAGARPTSKPPGSTSVKSKVSPPSTAKPSSTSTAPKKISSRLDPHKTSNPFTAKNKYKTNFGRVYDAGEIPCRIHHSTAKMFLRWDVPVEELEYDPLLVVVTEGIRETTHPYVIIARQAFEEMCKAEGATEKITPMVSKLITPLRGALISTEPGVFEYSLDAIQLLSTAVGGAIAEHLNVLLIPINKKSFDKNYSTRIHALLNHIEEKAGPEHKAEVVKLIKAKIPTYRPLIS